MPAANSIVKYWNQQQTMLSENLEILRQRPRKIPTHHLRVSVKKLRSFLRLWQEITGEDWRKDFGQVKKLYQSVGKFRDLGMAQLLLLKFQRKENIILSSFKKNLGALCAISRRWLTQAAHEYESTQPGLMFARVHDNLSGIPGDELVQIISELVKKSLQKTRKLSGHFRKNAHEIRKLLKDVYYWLKVCSPNPVFKASEMKTLKKALDNLGIRQDQVEFERKLKHFRQEYLVKGSEEFTKSKKLEIILNKNEEELLDDAEKRIRELLEKK